MPEESAAERSAAITPNLVSLDSDIISSERHGAGCFEYRTEYLPLNVTEAYIHPLVFRIHGIHRSR